MSNSGWRSQRCATRALHLHFGRLKAFDRAQPSSATTFLVPSKRHPPIPDNSSDLPRAVRFAVTEPSVSSLNEMASLEARNPFHTPAYVHARETQGNRVFIFNLYEGDRLTAACPALVRTGTLERLLELPSLPRQTGEQFWKGMLEFCRNRRVSRVVVDTFASESATFPVLPGEVMRRQRCEYVLDLGDGPLLSRVASNHRRNLHRAEVLGVAIRRTRDEAACEQHARLIEASLHRRDARGESVAVKQSAQALLPLLADGAAELFQATLGETVLSSVLVLRAVHGGYYHSAGTSPEGMRCGASHFLIVSIADSLRSNGADVFNLGGADADSEGLRRFKLGFGARPVALEAAEAEFGGQLRHKVAWGVRQARRASSALLQELVGRRGH